MRQDKGFSVNWKPVFFLLLLAVAVFFVYNYWRGEKARELEELGSCELSLCNCKCYLKGSTPELVEERVCGTNCLEELNIAGCELVGDVCVEVKGSPRLEGGAGVANPASENCVKKGYSLEIQSNASGQFGVCVFPDGTQCEEWALFKGECNFTRAS